MYYSSLATGFNPDNAASVTLTGNSAGYCLTEFAIGCGTKISKAFLKNIRFKLEVNNLLNRKVQIMDSINGNSMILFNPLPTRNYFISASAEF